MRRIILPLLLLPLACGHINEATLAHDQAATQGKYHVTLTGDIEAVAGRCQFVRNIIPDDEPAFRPTDAQLPDYFRTEAVYNGADTVVVRGRVGEAYICGPGPLNPDGTRKKEDAGPH